MPYPNSQTAHSTNCHTAIQPSTDIATIIGMAMAAGSFSPGGRWPEADVRKGVDIGLTCGMGLT